MQYTKPNVFSLGGVVHAGMLSEVRAYCGARSMAGFHETSSSVTCKTCISKLEGERFAPLRGFSTTELALYEQRKRFAELG